MSAPSLTTRREALLAGVAWRTAYAANDRIGLGLIGVGIRGTQLLNSFQAIPGVEICAAADVYDGHLLAVREATRADLPVTRDYTDILQRRDVDAVIIATPDHWHARMVTDALQAGKHVYIEKPFTWSIEQGIAVRQAAQESNRVVQVGSGAGSSAAALKARELIRAGVLGSVNMIRMANNRNTPEGAWIYPIPPDASPRTIDWDRFLGPAPKREFDAKVFFRWRCWWEYSGGVATDLFVHLLTLIHGVMGVAGPVSVVSQGGLYRWKDGRTVPDVLNSIFEYKEGFLADVYVNLANGRAAHPTTIMGTEASLVFEDRDRLMLYPEPEPPPVQRYGSLGWPSEMRERYLKSAGDARPAARKPEEIKVERGPSHQERFIQAVRAGRNLVETAAEGLAASGAAALANLAFRRGRRVSWNPETGQVLET